MPDVTTSTTTSAPPTAPAQTSPAPDGAGAPVAAVDAAGEGTPVDDSTDKPTDEIAKARAERDASKRARRDAEARADALAARVAELEQHAAEAERLRGELSTITASRRQERLRQVVGKIEQAMAPPMRGSHVGPLVEAFAQVRGIDVDADDAAAVILAKLRTHSPGLFAPHSPSSVPPSGFRSPI